MYQADEEDEQKIVCLEEQGKITVANMHEVRKQFPQKQNYIPCKPSLME
jgi:hypothetical protein